MRCPPFDNLTHVPRLKKENGARDRLVYRGMWDTICPQTKTPIFRLTSPIFETAIGPIEERSLSSR